MAKRFVTSIVFLFALLSSIALAAQNDVPMADIMRENGKIYVVVAILAIIFAGIVVYLIAIDRKTARLKKELDEMKK
jgi:CcmD family protein